MREFLHGDRWTMAEEAFSTAGWGDVLPTQTMAWQHCCDIT
jgi:hypothetical protein